MLEIRTKILSLILATVLLVMLAMPVVSALGQASLAVQDDTRPALFEDAGRDSQPAAAIASHTCTGGSDGQCGG